MGDLDPVSWDASVAALGPPAAQVEDYVDRFAEEVRGDPPYEAVKTIHDALSGADVDRTVPGLGEPFVTAYLLEEQGIIGPDGSETDYRSLVERRPDAPRLRELFWENERTLWWIGVLVGVHPSLVTYWLYEDDIPLMERNYTEESLRRIREVQRSDTG